jgi:hypothetical protein
MMEAAAMPRYYFDIRDDDTTIDSEGMEFADAHAAIAFAYKAARDIAAESAVAGKLVTEHRIEIVDADRQLIDTVTFGEAVGIDP